MKEKKDKKEKKTKKTKKEKSSSSSSSVPLPPLSVALFSPPSCSSYSPSVTLTSTDSYFTHNKHFKLYLYITKNTKFGSLTSSQSHKLFAEFVKSWNDGELSQSYYDGGTEFDKACDEAGKKGDGGGWNFRVTERESGILGMIKKGSGGEGGGRMRRRRCLKS